MKVGMTVERIEDGQPVTEPPPPLQYLRSELGLTTGDSPHGIGMWVRPADPSRGQDSDYTITDIETCSCGAGITVTAEHTDGPRKSRDQVTEAVGETLDVIRDPSPPWEYLGWQNHACE